MVAREIANAGQKRVILDYCIWDAEAERDGFGVMMVVVVMMVMVVSGRAG